LNSDGSARIIFDLETVPLDEARDYLEAVEAPAHYKDPEKIAAYLAEHATEQLARCALDPDLCRIVAIGWWREDEPEPTALTLADGTESEMLEQFWRKAAGRHYVGFNCVPFDLPVLLRRSLYVGVAAPALQVDRFRHTHITDLLQVLSHHGMLRYHSLGFYARRFGCDVPDGLTGADIGQAVAEGRWRDVAGHVRADVEKTAGVAGKLGYFSRC
jgi:hypothetical protein